MARQKRSLFNMIFGSNKPRQPTGQATQLKMLNGYVPVFSQFGNDAYASDVVRSAIDAIARNAAKLQPKYRRKDNQGNIILLNNNIQYLLDTRPNPYMSAYDFRYKVVTQLYMQNNAFIYIALDINGNPQGFYPLNFSNMEFLESDGEIFAKFTFLNGNFITVPYAQLIHLRRFYYNDDLFGERNDYALYPTLELIHATDQGIINAIKTSAFIRGILKFTQILKRQDRFDRTEDFVKDYMNINNNGGVASIDGSCEYQNIGSEPKMVNSSQMDFIEQKVYKYFSISKEIVMSNYTEEQWNAFYESVLEPIGIQLSQEFTEKIFTKTERSFGNEIVFEANRLQYASNTTKVEVGTFLTNIGAASLDDILDMFNMPTIGGEEGARRVQTLNMVNSQIADQYQTGTDNASEGGENVNARNSKTSTNSKRNKNNKYKNRT